MNFLRLATLTVASFLVSACNPLMTASMDTLKAAFEGPEALELTRQQVDATPYYQITIAAPSVTPMLNVAAAINGNDDVTPTTTNGTEPSPHISIIVDR